MGLTEKRPLDHRRAEYRRTLILYALLTTVLFVPLLIAFAFVRNTYPFAASTMMIPGRDAQSGRDYYVLRGETAAGQTIDLPAITLTDALTGRNWSVVSAAIQNSSFRIRWPHPANSAMAQAYDGADKLPRAARLEDLLRAWGEIYNSQLSGPSNQRLKSVRLDAYRWEGGINGEYDRFIESWRVEL